MLARISSPFARDRRRNQTARDGNEPATSSQNVEARFSERKEHAQFGLPLTFVTAAPSSSFHADYPPVAPAQNTYEQASRNTTFQARHKPSVPSFSSPLNHTPRYPATASTAPTSTQSTPNLPLPTRPEPAHLSTRSSTPPTPFSSSCDTLNECCAPCARAPRKIGKMGLTKSQRIGILLGIDSVFFLVELTVGMYPRLPLDRPD